VAGAHPGITLFAAATAVFVTWLTARTPPTGRREAARAMAWDRTPPPAEAAVKAATRDLSDAAWLRGEGMMQTAELLATIDAAGRNELLPMQTIDDLQAAILRPQEQHRHSCGCISTGLTKGGCVKIPCATHRGGFTYAARADGTPQWLPCEPPASPRVPSVVDHEWSTVVDDQCGCRYRSRVDDLGRSVELCAEHTRNPHPSLDVVWATRINDAAAAQHVAKARAVEELDHMIDDLRRALNGALHDARRAAEEDAQIEKITRWMGAL